MALVHHLQALTRQAAEILPGPPSRDDRAGLQAWESLVRRTADRLAELAGVRAPGPAAPVPVRKLSCEDLLALVEAGSAGSTPSRPSVADGAAGPGRASRRPRVTAVAEVRRRAARRRVRTSSALGALHCPGASRVG